MRGGVWDLDEEDKEYGYKYGDIHHVIVIFISYKNMIMISSFFKYNIHAFFILYHKMEHMHPLSQEKEERKKR